MMNQDQYHASLLNKGQPIGMGWDGITKSQQQKIYPMDPPNNTDIEDSVKRVKDDDPKLIELNLNNIKVCFLRIVFRNFWFQATTSNLKMPSITLYLFVHGL